MVLPVKPMHYFNRTKYDLISIYTAAPQSSVLGPLLFSIYINIDLPKWISLFNDSMYTNDTTLCCDIDTIPIEDRYFILNNELFLKFWMECFRKKCFFDTAYYFT